MEPHVDENGNQYWFKDGKRHREDGPAIIYANGDQYWYRNGKRHREDGPAGIDADGDQYWYRDGKRHREVDPAVMYSDGHHEWFKDGKRHREDGPAFSFGLYEMWYDNGILMKSNAMDFGIEHYMINVVPPLFLYNVKYEVFNMNVGLLMYRRLPSNTVYKNCIINFDVCNYDDKFIDCVFIETTT